MEKLVKKYTCLEFSSICTFVPSAVKLSLLSISSLSLSASLSSSIYVYE